MKSSNAHLFLPLVKALIEGKTIQIQISGQWVDLDVEQEISFDLLPCFYRVKPTILKYRRFIERIHGHEGEMFVDTCVSDGDAKLVEKSGNFVRWIDTEWQEVEP